MPANSSESHPRVALISEYPPPAAGMPVQAEQLLVRFQQQGFPIRAIRTNPRFSGFLSWLDGIRGLRGLLKLLVFLFQCRTIARVDIVHIFSASGLNYFLFTLPPIVIARLLGKAVIINYHGGAAKVFFERFPGVFRWSMKRADRLVVPSGYLRDIFLAMGEESLIVPNLANVDRFHFRQRGKFRPVILSARNLTNVYNVQCAIHAFKTIVETWPEAELYIAGDGPEKANLEKLARQYQLENRVHFLGNVANDKMSDLYDRCDIFINTSNVDNMPGSILEAYASGLPVVSTNVGGIPYLVDDGVSGLLSYANDGEGLAKHILTLLDNQELAAGMVEKGREKLAQLGWDQVSRGWLAVYADLYPVRKEHPEA